MTRELRHINFHPNIVANFRQSLPALSIFSDDVIYFAYEWWSTSEDYPNELKLYDWIEAYDSELRSATQKLSKEEAILRSHQRWEKRFYGEVKTHE